MELIFIFSILIISATIAAFTKHRVAIESLSVIATLSALIGAVVIALRVSSSGFYSPVPFFFVDSLGAIMMLIVGFVGLAITIYSIQYLRQETAKNIIGFTRVKQYFVLLNLFLAAMFLTITASSPIFAWISIEATTLSTAFLISFYNKPSSLEAAWKYLMINSIGLLLGFLGTLLYFTSVSSLNLHGIISWQVIMENATHLDPMIAKIAFILALIGYGTKVGLAPMHTWLPDAHSKAPAPISALLSGVLLNVALIMVLRFKAITDASIGNVFSNNLLMVFALLSIIIAALIIFTQKNYKRLIAYSSIENMGFVALGFSFGGIGVFAAILHVIYNALIKSALFLSAGTIFLRYSSTKIAKVKGVINALPITSVLFLLAFLGITGMPPFGTFLTKVFIFSAGISVHPIITVITLLFMAVLFIGFLRHVVSMVFGEKPVDIKSGEENLWLIVPPLALLGVALYFSLFMPDFLKILINDVVLHY